MERKAVTLHGAFHGANFGDLLLLQIQLAWLSEVGITEICIPGMNDLDLDLIDIPDGLRLNRCTSDLIVFGGGGYFGAPGRAKWKWTLNWIRHHARILILAALTRRKVFLLGTGVGPLPPLPLSYFLKLALKKAELIMPRDEESVAYLRELLGCESETTVDLGTDIAVWLAGQEVTKRERNSKAEVLGIHLAPPPDDVPSFEEFLDWLGRRLTGYGFRLKVLVDQKNTNGAKRQLQSGIRVAKESGLEYEVVKLESINQFVDSIGECDRIITSKLHVGVVARCKQVEVLSIPTHVKTIRFYRQIGEKHRCHPWGVESLSSLHDAVDVFLDSSVSPQGIRREIIERAEEMKNAFQQVISESVTDLKNLSEKP